MDLHLHTSASDGTLEPQALAAAVRRQGVDLWAVADHDTLAGWRELAGQPGLVPGVEATAGADGREIHIVGLGIDPDHAGLADLLAGNRALRRRRIEVLISRLPAKLAGGMTPDDVARLGAPRVPDSLTRLHLARALVARGCLCSTSRAFADYLGDEHAADAGLPQFPSVRATAEAIRAAGGLAILAHPGQHGSMPAIEALMAEGLDGLEVRHPGLDTTLAAAMDARAAETGWWCSAGSDLHYLGARRPGMCRLDAAREDRMRRRLVLEAA